MAEDTARIERDRQMILDAKAKGTGAKMLAYTRLSGPGWLQSAITLGGGSLTGALYLGVLAGTELLWVQLFAMIMGVIMLSAIAYVTLSTEERPFRAINQHVNPVLGWSWAIATLMANVVWCLPQFSLGVSAVRQNLLPDVLGETSGMPEFQGKLIVAVTLLLIATIVIWFYDSGAKGIKIFETLLKLMVGVVVISFFGVVAMMAVNGALDWSGIFSGFIPDISYFYEPAERFDETLAATGPYREYWAAGIVADQRDVMITAAATAVGINMTFLLPYSMLARGWGKDFRGLATFDLSTGLLVPYILATSCVVIAAASQFHGQPAPGLTGETNEQGALVLASSNVDSAFMGNATARLQKPAGAATEAELKQLAQRVGSLKTAQAEHMKQLAAKRQEMTPEQFADYLVEQSAKPEAVAKSRALMDDDKFIFAATNSPYIRNGPLDQAIFALPEADQKMAAMLAKRDAFDLADSLSRLTGREVGQYVFGIGVLGMALSTIIILMLISGFTVCEMLGIPPKGNPRRFACLISGVGILGPFIWQGKSQFWLAVPTSVFGFMLLPIAFWTFFGMMNSKALMGDRMPRGGRRVLWNTLMLIALTYATIGAAWNIWSRKGPMFGVQIRWIAIGIVGLIVALALIVQVMRARRPRTDGM